MIVAADGGCSSAWLEPQIVDLVVAGSNPVSHPSFFQSDSAAVALSACAKSPPETRNAAAVWHPPQLIQHLLKQPDNPEHPPEHHRPRSQADQNPDRVIHRFPFVLFQSLLEGLCFMSYTSDRRPAPAQHRSLRFLRVSGLRSNSQQGAKWGQVRVQIKPETREPNRLDLFTLGWLTGLNPRSICLVLNDQVMQLEHCAAAGRLKSTGDSPIIPQTGPSTRAETEGRNRRAETGLRLVSFCATSAAMAKKALLKERVESSLKAKVEKAASERGETEAFVIRDALKEYFERQDHTDSVQPSLMPAGPVKYRLRRVRPPAP